MEQIIYTEDSPLIGYKGLKKENGILKCRDMEYKVGSIYVSNEIPAACSKGFHLCKNLEEVFKHYDDENTSHVFYEVKAWGKMDITSDKIATQYIQLTKEVSKEVLLTAKLKKSLDSVDRIVAANKNAIICGSLALIIRGWMPYRKVGDIDISMPYFSQFGGNKTIVLEETQDDDQGRIEEEFGGSGNDTIRYKLSDGTNFDLFIDPKETWSWITIKNKAYKVAHVKRTIEAKMRYSLNGNHKHSRDLIEILKNAADSNKEKCFLGNYDSVFKSSTSEEIAAAKK